MFVIPRGGSEALATVPACSTSTLPRGARKRWAGHAQYPRTACRVSDIYNKQPLQAGSRILPARSSPPPTHTLSPMTNDDPKQAYREAYEAWQKHLSGVHDFLLEGNRLPPEQIKGLLNREARAKEKYDEARRRLLGIDN